MKLAHARIVTNDVPALTRFYRDVTGVAPKGDEVYVEFHGPALALAISSQQMIERYGAGATTPAANRPVILDFEVADVDAERLRLGSLVREFVLEQVTQRWGNQSILFRDPDGNLINMFARARSEV
jgi:catechol 2,3-dioxygenase-like lactoylglutathione lyase family enzyme